MYWAQNSSINFPFKNVCFLSLFVIAQDSDGPNQKGLPDRLGGTLELGCNLPRRRILQNQTMGI